MLLLPPAKYELKSKKNPKNSELLKHTERAPDEIVIKTSLRVLFAGGKNSSWMCEGTKGIISQTLFPPLVFSTVWSP